MNLQAIKIGELQGKTSHFHCLTYLKQIGLEATVRNFCTNYEWNTYSMKRVKINSMFIL